jgi:FtsZ-interacting cell division protein ZipA
MTDLQASLIGIGGAIVVGVISYNKWQEFKARKTVERAFAAPEEDVLMGGAAGPAGPVAERREPTLVSAKAPAGAPATDSGEMAAATEPAQPDQQLDQHQDQPQEQQLEQQAEDMAAPAQSRLPVDQLIDCAVMLALEAPLRGEKILPAIEGLRHVGGKPVHYIGRPEDGPWEAVSHGRVYRALQAGIQMANRGSALNELEYSEFVTRLGQLADELGAMPDLPDMMEIMPAARSLHQFIVEYGAQLSVNVQANHAPWVLTTLLAALERQGFDQRPDGRLVMPDGDGGVLFSLSTNATPADQSTSRLTLLLDVPCVAPARDGFNAMVACARSLAARLDGTVVDDGNQPLPAQALEEIASQVQAFYGEMEAVQVAAGSHRALRLFG